MVGWKEVAAALFARSHFYSASGATSIVAGHHPRDPFPGDGSDRASTTAVNQAVPLQAHHRRDGSLLGR
jgi:hypothetical protein